SAHLLAGAGLHGRGYAPARIRPDDCDLQARSKWMEVQPVPLNSAASRRSLRPAASLVATTGRPSRLLADRIKARCAVRSRRTDVTVVSFSVRAFSGSVGPFPLPHRLFGPPVANRLHAPRSPYRTRANG